MKIIYSITDLQPESGGPTRSISALAGAVAELGNEVNVVALEYRGGRTAPMIPPLPVKTTLVPCQVAWAEKMKWSPAFAQTLRVAATPDHQTTRRRGETGPVVHSPVVRSPVVCSPVVILHDNGLWLPTNHTAARVARRFKVPFIVSPRGMLTPWAMRYRGFKKRLAWSLYQRRDLQAAQVLHATSRQEAEEFRSLGLTQPIAVIPNGVCLPPRNPNSEIGNRKSEMRTILFLGRIHRVKGLLDLVEAWALINRKSEIGNRKSEGWRVVVAGGDEGGHLAEVKAEIRKQKLENRFEFIGEVADEKKWDVYRSADLFVLPTKTENFGIAIAEALACGLPVITTRGTPWEDLVKHRCGWWVEIGAQPLAEALTEAMRLSDEERLAMGQRGRELVEENYTWPAAAKKMVAVYQWMLGIGDKPEWVI